MNSVLFDALSKAYGHESPWTGVESVLKSEGRFVDANDFHDPFKNLVIVILSQNTNDKNSTRAYAGLVKRFGSLTPQLLASANEEEIRESIKPGGLYNLKAKRIKNLAKIVVEKFNSDLVPLTKLPKDKAMSTLLEIPGIGRKSADVFLAYCANRDVIPIDTNIDRVAKRIGLVPPNATYDKMQKALERVIPAGQRVRGHELLVRVGRDCCKPRNPLCKICPIAQFCKKNF